MTAIKGSGIYSITCLPTGDVYIGSTNDFARRWYEHKRELTKKIHTNQHLTRAWHKYGADSFEFKVVENCLPDIRISREIYWVEAINPQFNRRPPSMSWEGYVVSVETRKKLSATHVPHNNSSETRAKISKARKGSKMPSTTRDAIRKANVGRASEKRGVPLTEDHKRKVSLSLKGKPSARKGRKFPKRYANQLELL